MSGTSAVREQDDDRRPTIDGDGLLSGDDIVVNLDDLEERSARTGGADDKEKDDKGADRNDDQFHDNVSEDERERIRARRKEQRSQRGDKRRDESMRKDAVIADLQTGMRAMQQELQRIQNAGVMGDMAAMEARMAELQTSYKAAEALHTKAVAEQNGVGATTAMQAMNGAQEEFNRLSANREAIARRETQKREQMQRGPRVDPTIAAHARKFVDEHEWYDPQAGDRDSARVKAIDKQMETEGWDARTAGYWDELRERVREAMPAKFERQRGQDDDDLPRRRGSPTGGGGRDGGGEGAREFKVPREYIQNLKDAGMWDDLKTRNKMLKKFHETKTALDARGGRS